MKKIIGSLIAIVLTVGLVAGGAYALFSDTVEVQGITITSGSAVLKVKKMGTGWEDSVSFNNAQWMEPLFPGHQNTNPITFWLKNQSTANIDLKVTGKIVSGATGDAWDALKNVVFIRVTNFYAPGSPATDWISLKDWKNLGGKLPQLLSPVGDDDEFRMEVMMHEDAGNEAAGQLLQDLVFEFTGTQVVTP